MSKLDSLIVDLELNSAALRTGLDQAASAIGAFGKKVEGIAESLHSLTEMKGFEIGKEAIEKLGEFVQKGAEAAAQMGILAQAAGVPVEAFSRLSYAANLSGVATDELGGIFNKLNKNIALAGAGVPAQVALFHGLGVSVKDASGNVKNASTVMSELAGVFSSFGDGASKSALEMQALGKTGASLNAFFALGADGLAKLGDEADRFGITTGPEAAEAAHHFEQSLTKLELAAQAVGKRVAVELAPALTQFANQLLSSKEGTDALKGAADVLTTALRLLVSGGIIVGAVFDAVGTTIGRVASTIVSASQGHFKEAAAGMAALFRADDAVEAGKAAAARLKVAWEDASKPVEEHGKIVKKTMDDVLRNVEEGKKGITASEEAWKSLNKTLETWQTRVAEYGKSPLEALEQQLTSGKMLDELGKLGDKARAMYDELHKAGAEFIALEAAALQAKVTFDVGRADAATGITVANKTRDFNNVGATPFAVRAQQESGFTSFNDAMATFAKQTERNAALIGDAEILRANKDIAGAEALTIFADQAKHAADVAALAGEAFKSSAEAVNQQLESMVGSITSKMGDVGEIINAGVQGFKNGGVLGAIIGVIAAIITKLESFTMIVDSMNTAFHSYLDMINQMMKPMTTGIINLAETIGMLFETIQRVTGSFEVLYAIGFALGKVLDVVALAFLYTAKAVADVGGGNQDINNQITKITNDLNKGYHEVDAAAPPAAAGLTAVATAAAAVTEKFNQMLTNLPSGYKIGAAIFGATGAGGPAAGSSGSTGTTGTGAGGGAAAGTTGSKKTDNSVTGGTDQNSTEQGDTSYNAFTGQTKNQGDANANNENTRLPGGAGKTTTGTGLTASSLTGPEQQLWAQMFQNALAMGMSAADASSVADAYVLSLRSGSSGGGGSHAHSSGGGGGDTSSGALSSDSTRGGGSVTNEFHFHGPLMPKNFEEFVKQIGQVATAQAGARRRNPHSKR